MNEPEITKKIAEQAKAEAEYFSNVSDFDKVSEEERLENVRISAEERLLKMQAALSASQNQVFKPPIPEQAKYTKYLVEEDNFVYEQDGEGNLHLKGGDIPGFLKEQFHGFTNRGSVLTNLSRHEARVVDMQYMIAELSAMMGIPERQFTAQLNHELDNMCNIQYARTRRSIEGFTMKELNRVIQENITTLHTEGEAQARKRGLRDFLSGR